MKRTLRSVLLFRAAKQPEDPYDLALSRACYRPHFIPVLQFHFTDQETLSASLLDSSRYSGLVFTSQTAVEAASAALSGLSANGRSQLEERWSKLPVFVVGKATANSVSKLGLRAFGSYGGNAEELGEVIIEYFSSREQTCPLLFPCSNLKRETLPSALRKVGLGLEALVSYTTEPHPDIAGNISSGLADRLAGGDGDSSVYAVFFSPSGVNYAVEKFMEACKNKVSIKFVAIGPTSAEALSNCGHPPSAVAAKPTPDSLVAALELIS